MLLRQIERVQRASIVQCLVVATSTDASDDVIETLCYNAGVSCFRGSLEDVLDRFYQAARPLAPEHVIRLTGDCPLADPALIDQLVAYHLDGGFDYASNALIPTYPDGLDAEVFRFECLEQAWREANLPSQREHVTPFIHQQPDRFKIGTLRCEPNLSHLRWTVDEAEDFELVSRIYAELLPVNPTFATADVLRLLERVPELAQFNTGIYRNEGYLKSLADDTQYLKQKES